jgi:23S rRNA (cytidine2498-2'-O)-methyltransferase
MRYVFTCEPDWETPLAAELERTLGAATANEARSIIATSGRVDVALDDEIRTPPTVAFARQCFPDAVSIEAESIGRWADVACERISAKLDAVENFWRLHVFAAPFGDGSTGFRRCRLIEAKLLEKLKQVRRRLARRIQPNAEAPWAENEALVQILLTSPESGYVSVCDAATRRMLRRCVSRFVAGEVEPAVDKLAPSRAFAKLVEAETRLGRPIREGETCVDLGASPGSWTYTAIQRGARVTAIDRSPLRDDLMHHAQLEFLQTDAFRYAPPEPIDWLLSDIIAFPDRIRELLADWLGARRCRFFCVTVKFRGRDDDAELESVKRVLETSGYEYGLRRLSANKNEATAYGYLPDGIELKAGASLA